MAKVIHGKLIEAEESDIVGNTLVIGDDVTVISGNCTSKIRKSFKYLKISKSVKVIESGAFKWCSSLIEVDLPWSIKKLGSQAFMNCGDLIRIRQSKLPPLREISEYAFSGCVKLKEVNFDDSTLEIGQCAFSGCRSLKRLKLPKELLRVNTRAFSSCTGITQIEFNDELEEIGEEAFRETQLRQLNLKDKVRVIGAQAFGYTKFKCAIIPESVINIGNACFSGNKHLDTLVIKNMDAILNFKSASISGNKHLDTLVIKNIDAVLNYKSTSIVHSISNSEKLKIVTIPYIDNSIEKIVSNMFEEANNLCEIHAKNKVVEVVVNTVQGKINEIVERQGNLLGYDRCILREFGGEVSDVIGYINGSKRVIGGAYLEKEMIAKVKRMVKAEFLQDVVS